MAWYDQKSCFVSAYVSAREAFVGSQECCDAGRNGKIEQDIGVKMLVIVYN